MTYSQILAYIRELKKRNINEITVYEFGVYKGDSLLLLKQLAGKYNIKIKSVYAFDSFRGLPKEQDDIPVHDDFYEGNFKLTEGIGSILDKLHQKICVENLYVVPGYFSEIDIETDVVLEKLEVADIVHVDSDLYISAYQALDFLCRKKLIKQNTIISYNEWDSIKDGGEKLAHTHICDKYKLKTKCIWYSNDGLGQYNFIILKNPFKKSLWQRFVDFIRKFLD